MLVGSLPAGPGAPALWQMWRWTREPLAFMDACRREFGPVFTLQSPNVGPIVAVSDPASVQSVFTASPDVVLNGPSLGFMEPLVGPHSLFLLDGPAHHRVRRMVMPALHGPRLRSYSMLVHDTAVAAVSRLVPGQELSLLRLFSQVSMEIIVRAVYGVAPDQVAYAAGLLHELTQAVTPSLLFFPMLRRDLGSWSPGGRMRAAMQAVDQLIAGLIAERRDDPQAHHDVLALLMSARDEGGEPLSDVELRDQLLTLLTAGHETTQSSLCWTLQHLLDHPADLDRVRRELDGVDDPDDRKALAWLGACCEEALRYVPVIPSMGRTLAAPLRVGDLDLSAGVRVMPVAYLSHRDPDQWDEPDRFRPQRFLDHTPSPWAFYPFGGGARRCIGAAFARLEMRLITAAVVSGVDLEPLRSRPGARRSNLALVPDGGVPVRVVARRDGAKYLGQRS